MNNTYIYEINLMFGFAIFLFILKLMHIIITIR